MRILKRSFYSYCVPKLELGNEGNETNEDEWNEGQNWNLGMRKNERAGGEGDVLVLSGRLTSFFERFEWFSV